LHFPKFLFFGFGLEKASALCKRFDASSRNNVWALLFLPESKTALILERVSI
jgi:hypothetical protein